MSNVDAQALSAEPERVLRTYPGRVSGRRLVEERNAAFAESSEWWKRAAMVGWACFAGAVFVGFPAAYFTGRTPPALLGLNQAGQVLPLPLLSDPYVTEAALKRFCQESITEVMTFGHHDYALRMEGVRWRFTKESFAKFTAAMAANVIPGMKQFLQLYSSSTSEPCRIIGEGNLPNGTYWWKLEGRGQLMVSSGSHGQPYTSTYQIQVVRVSPLESKEMLQIYDWVEVRK
jgi:hypothetical protein